MSTFAVVVFPDEKRAYEGLRAYRELHAEGILTVYGTAVVQRDAQGALSILKRKDQGPLGTGVGALLGGVIGLFGGPVGAAIGLLGGAVAGGVRDCVHLEVSDEFLHRIEVDLTPGKFAVIAEVSEEWGAPLDTRMEALGAKVMREERETFEDDLLEKRVNVRKAALARRKAERAQRKAERTAERAGAKANSMEVLLAADIGDELWKLENMAEKAAKRLDAAKQELDAKLEALQAQASGAKPEVRSRIDQRIADIRKEFAKREEILTRAKELARQVLNYQWQ